MKKVPPAHHSVMVEGGYYAREEAKKVQIAPPPGTTAWDTSMKECVLVKGGTSRGEGDNEDQ